MKVCFETFGCRLNKAEALQQEADYLARGWEITTRHSEADLFVVRGCSVTARAQYECEKLIAHLRRHHPTSQLLIEGCLKPQTGTSLKPMPAKAAPPSKAATEAIPVRTARAYLKVQDGCSGHCTFCIVPQFRGKSVSIPFTVLIDRARRFIDAGYHEIVVTGCNLSLYASEGQRLPELLSALASLSPDCRIRIGSLEPGEIAQRCIDIIAGTHNLCRFLHLPIQSGSNRVLLAMRRPYGVDDVERLLESAAERLPDLGLGCDIMTGFPGESELDYLSTRSLLERYPFSNAHIFPYSERPGTPAAGLSTALPRQLRVHRAHELSRLMTERRNAFARRFVGRTVEMVVEGKTRAVGWTSEYLPCEARGKAARKSLVKVAVNQFLHGKLRGNIIPG